MVNSITVDTSLVSFLFSFSLSLPPSSDVTSRGSVNNLPEHTTHYTALHLCASIFTHSNQHHSFLFSVSFFSFEKKSFSKERLNCKHRVFFFFPSIILLSFFKSISVRTHRDRSIDVFKFISKDREPWLMNKKTNHNVIMNYAQVDMCVLLSRIIRRKKNYHVVVCQFVFVFIFLLIAFTHSLSYFISFFLSLSLCRFFFRFQFAFCLRKDGEDEISK